MKKIKKLIIVILMMIIIPTVNAKSMKATDYIKKIADDAGGDPNSVEVIGNTSLAYDGTTDNNLRYVGLNPNNYVKFNDELWRIIGVMNNVEDENGDISPKLKLVRDKNIEPYIAYEINDLSINSKNGINEWGQSDLYKTLNPGFNNNTKNISGISGNVNNSLYWNRTNGKCLKMDYTWVYPNWEKYLINTFNCDFSNDGMKNESKNLIENVYWKTGSIPSNYNDITVYDLYQSERGNAVKCTTNTTTCNDDVTRSNKTLGRVGLLYPSDYVISTHTDGNRGSFFSNPVEQCNHYYRDKWIYSGWSISPINNENEGFNVAYYDNNYGIVSKTASGTWNQYEYIYPSIYFKNSVIITGGKGTYSNPYIVHDKSYEKLSLDSSKKINSNHNDKYSVDDLLNNYDLITLGTKNNNLTNNYKNIFSDIKKGDSLGISETSNPVLINGDFNTNTEYGFISKDNINGISFIKGNYGDNIITEGKIATNKDYINFDEMYAHIVNEQQILVENTEYHINKEKIEVTKPGTYIINNTASSYDYISKTYTHNYTDWPGFNATAKNIYIDNYDQNNYYIFNVMKLFEDIDYHVYIKEQNDPSFQEFNIFVESGKYKGNIVFNYPNARFINLSFVSGKIIAPKADIYLNPYHEEDNASIINESIIANSVLGDNIIIKGHPNKTTKRLINQTAKKYIVEPTDYTDDLYTYDYSLKSLLENYNVVSFGKKEYNDNTKFKSLGYRNGSVALFHIDGQFLVNGDLGTENENYAGYVTEYGDDNNRITNLMRLDLDSNLITESYAKGENKTDFYTKNWNTNIPVFGSKNNYFIDYQNFNTNTNNNYNYSSSMYAEGTRVINKDFINFNRLYDNVIAETKAIKPGQDVEVKNGKAHIKVGTNYVINDINEIDEIIFDDFENNKNKMTMITIQNAGDINFPKMSADNVGLIETNDYYGKTEATQIYEVDRDFNDKYHGNIVWNVPNATYIKLAANAPFAGHLIAPKADVESPETHFSGCFIVNSLYCEGNTEAHFYPLTATEMDETYIDSKGKVKTRRTDVATVLGEDNSIIEMKVVGDQEEYERDKNKQSITELLVNPATYGNLFVIIIILLAPGVLVARYKKKITQ